MSETQLVPMLGDYEAQFQRAIWAGLREAGIGAPHAAPHTGITILQALLPVLNAYRWDIVGAQEAAQILGLSKSRFHELKARGDFDGKQLADKVVYRGEDIRAYAANRKAT